MNFSVKKKKAKSIAFWGILSWQ